MTESISQDNPRIDRPAEWLVQGAHKAVPPWLAMFRRGSRGVNLLGGYGGGANLADPHFGLVAGEGFEPSTFGL